MSRPVTATAPSIGDHLTRFRSTISVVDRFFGGDGFVNNEFWLVNYNGQGGWIELGYQASTYQLPKYFYAVLDPDTQTYISHDIAEIPQEELGTRVSFDVHQTADNTFVVSVERTKAHFSTSVTVHLWDATYGGYVNLGQELAGKRNAAANLAMFVSKSSTTRRSTRTRRRTPIDPPMRPWTSRRSAGGCRSPRAGIKAGCSQRGAVHRSTAKQPAASDPYLSPIRFTSSPKRGSFRSGS
jgi:hypothetical protein